MISILQLVAIGLLTGALAVGYGVSGHIVLSLTCLVLGVAWAMVDWFGFGRARKNTNLQAGVPQKLRRSGDPFTDNLATPIFIGLAGWGLWQKLPAWLMLVVVLLILAAWDLGRFSNRLSVVTDEATEDRLNKLHLSRLGVTLVAGLLLGGIALLLHVTLDFGWALVLGILAMLALNRFSRGLSR